jgi:hypothetical protein
MYRLTSDCRINYNYDPSWSIAQPIPRLLCGIATSWGIARCLADWCIRWLSWLEMAFRSDVSALLEHGGSVTDKL